MMMIFFSQVDSEPFFQACVSDTCFCDRGADCECMCTAVTAYATACNENNVAIAWRAEGYCRKFSFFFQRLLFHQFIFGFFFHKNITSIIQNEHLQENTNDTK